MENYYNKIKLHTIIQIIFFFFLIAIDQLTKYLAVLFLKNSGPVAVIKDFIEFRYLENTGAAFGIFENAMLFFYIVTIIVFIIILFLWIRLCKSLYSYINITEEKFKSKTFSNMIFFGYLLAALAAGAIGNLYDRVVNTFVVDFIYFKFINFPIFNFADICVTISIILICILFIFIYKEDKEFKLFKDKHEKN